MFFTNISWLFLAIYLSDEVQNHVAKFQESSLRIVIGKINVRKKII